MKTSNNIYNGTQFVELETGDYNIVSLNVTLENILVSANVVSQHFPRSRMFTKSNKGNLYYKEKMSNFNRIYLIKESIDINEYPHTNHCK